MLRFYETKVPKKMLCYVNVDTRVISKLVKTKSNLEYLIGCLVIRPLVFLLAEISGYVKT